MILYKYRSPSEESARTNDEGDTMANEMKSIEDIEDKAYEEGFLAAIAKAYETSEDFDEDDARQCLDELMDGRHYELADAEKATDDSCVLTVIRNIFEEEE